MISKPLVLTHVQETPLVARVTTLPPPFLSTIPLVPHQTTTPIPTPPITTDALTNITVVSESDALSAVQLRVVKLEKDVFELKKIDHPAKALATLKSQVATVVEQYLGSKIGDDLQKVLQRHTVDLIQKYSVKPAPESSKIQKPTIDLEQESEKSASEILKIKREQAFSYCLTKAPQIKQTFGPTQCDIKHPTMKMHQTRGTDNQKPQQHNNNSSPTTTTITNNKLPIPEEGGRATKTRLSQVNTVPYILNTLPNSQTNSENEKFPAGFADRVIYITLCSTIRRSGLAHEDLEQN
ncbi:hypothetical protein Tco_0797533 [Tanacetum coccineum]